VKQAQAKGEIKIMSHIRMTGNVKTKSTDEETDEETATNSKSEQDRKSFVGSCTE
jgi:hypothetical protein